MAALGRNVKDYFEETLKVSIIPTIEIAIMMTVVAREMWAPAEIRPISKVQKRMLKRDRPAMTDE
jgi:hypothetical protein